MGREHPAIAAGVDVFVAATAKTRLQIVDVPDGQHGFDYLDDEYSSRDAIVRAAELVLAELR